MTTLLLARVAISVIAATLAAAFAERALRDVGRPGRAAWAGALLLSGVASVVLAAGGRLPLPAPALLALLVAPRASGAPSAFAAAPPDTIAAGLVGWLVLALAVASFFAAGALRQRRRMRDARPTRMDGIDVLVAPALGPAVIGFTRPRIVVPAWLCGRPEQERRLVLRHEAEHVAARDPLLLAGALLVVCIVPWNPLLWYQLRRLRLAIELDCDARVLRRGDAREYGRLLVDVADRLARGAPLATALAFPRNFLERRIRMITNRRARPLRALACALGAGALLVAACADAADPVASEEPALTEATVEAREATEGDVVRARVPAPDAGVAPSRDIIFRAEPLDPSMRERTVVPFRAELGPDDRPTTILFEEGTPEEVQQAGRAELRQHRFRRSAANPDAPVEGLVEVE